MNELKLPADKKAVAVGPGNRWKAVYDYLIPYDLVVIGGRVREHNILA